MLYLKHYFYEPLNSRDYPATESRATNRKPHRRGLQLTSKGKAFFNYLEKLSPLLAIKIISIC